MVAISLYRGNLHRVPPDTPRRWLMPSHKLSIKHFRTLLSRRAKAVNSVSLTTSSSNPNPNDTQDADNDRKEGITELVQKVKEEEEVRDCEKVNELEGGREVKVEEGIDAVQAKVIEAVKADGEEQATVKPELSSEKLKRMSEVEEKLQVLNTKKHGLVQVLKLILNAEEEVKRRNSMQGLVARPPNPLQVDVSNDTGPRAGTEANRVSEMEGIEAEDASNQQMHSHHLLRMTSISPSSESPHGRLQPNTVFHPSRTNPGITVSPARFAPTGHQGQPANPPSVSVSGTGYIASSPSPAASGGTSAFRDSRLPSPWN